jgi:hypothetical protein
MTKNQQNTVIIVASVLASIVYLVTALCATVAFHILFAFGG